MREEKHPRMNIIKQWKESRITPSNHSEDLKCLQTVNKLYFVIVSQIRLLRSMSSLERPKTSLCPTQGLSYDSRTIFNPFHEAPMGQVCSVVYSVYVHTAAK